MDKISEALREDGKLWVVVVVIAIVLVGWAYDVFRTGRRMEKIKKRVKH